MIAVSPPEVTDNRIGPREPENPQIFRAVRELSEESRPNRKSAMEYAFNDLTTRKRYKVRTSFFRANAALFRCRC
jgi:hypothetical protein